MTYPSIICSDKIQCRQTKRFSSTCLKWHATVVLSNLEFSAAAGFDNFKTLAVVSARDGK